MVVLRWWTEHSWVTWWLSLALLVYSPPYPPPGLAALHGGAAGVWCASLVQGLRTTARQSVGKAGLIAVALFLPDLLPAMAAGGTRLIEYALGFTFPHRVIPPPLLLLGGVVAACMLTELLVRAIRGTRPAPPAAERWLQRQPGWVRLVGRVGQLAGALLLVLFLLVASMAVKVGWAKQQTQALCAEVSIAAPVAEVAARGRDRGLIVWSMEARAGEPAQVTAWEGFVFLRWFCTVEHRDGRVQSKHTFSLD